MAAEEPRPERSTTQARHGWVTAVLVGVVSLFLGLVVLPRMDGSSHALKDKPAPDFRLAVIHQGEEGSELQLQDLRGQIVLLDFWASWCGPCRAQAPIIDRVAKAQKPHKDVVFLGINSQDQRAAAVQFARTRRLSYASVFDPTGSTATRYGVSAFPTMVILDQQGVVRFVRSGLVQGAEIERVIESLR